MMGGWPRFAVLSEKCLPQDLEHGGTEVKAINMWIPENLDVWTGFCRLFASLPNLRELELHFNSFRDWSRHFEALRHVPLKKLCVNFVALEKGWLSGFNDLEVLSVRGTQFSSVQEVFFPPAISTVCVTHQDNNEKGKAAEFLASIPERATSLILVNFKLYRFTTVMDAVFGPSSHFEKVTALGNLWVSNDDDLQYLSLIHI